MSAVPVMRRLELCPHKILRVWCAECYAAQVPTATIRCDSCKEYTRVPCGVEVKCDGCAKRGETTFLLVT